MNRHAKQRRGAVIVIVALLIPVLFIIVGFSIDLAMMQCAKTELRTATDLAAKGAADELARTNSTSNAVARGQAIALANLVSGTGLQLDAADFEFGNTTTPDGSKWIFAPGVSPRNAVRVSGARGTGEPDGPIGLFFGSMHGIQNFEPQIRATAGFQIVDICLVLDRSSSMKLRIDESGGLPFSDPRTCLVPQADARWMLLHSAVNVFLDEIDATPAAENVAMVTYGGPTGSPPDCGGAPADGSVVSIDRDLTTNVTQVRSALTSRTNSVWYGNTDIEAGLQNGINVLANARSGSRKVIILLTDGQYTEASPIPLGSVAAADGIIVHTITFGNFANQTDMQAISTAANGVHMHAPDAATLNNSFRKLAALMAILTQ